MKNILFSLIAIISFQACSDDDMATPTNEDSKCFIFELETTSGSFTDLEIKVVDLEENELAQYSFTNDNSIYIFVSEPNAHTVITTHSDQGAIKIANWPLEDNDGWIGSSSLAYNYSMKEVACELELQLTATSFTDGCDTNTNSFDVEVEFLSDGEVIQNEDFSGNGNQSINSSKFSTSKELGLRVTLSNFQESNSAIGRGTGISDTKLDIISNGETLISEQLGGLLICTDTRYQLDFNYDRTTGKTTTTYKTHEF